MANRFTHSEKETVMRMKDDEDLFKKLARSVAPQVHGHDDVKRGLLLQLFGGIGK